MAVTSTIEIAGEEREIADAYAREQCAANAQNIATNAEGITGLNNNLVTKQPFDKLHGYYIDGINQFIYDNNAESIIFKAKKGSKYTLTNNGDRNIVGFSANYPSVGETLSNTTLNTNEVIAPIDGYCIWYVNSTLSNTILCSVETNNVGGVASEIVNVNDSLGDYGLDNVFDGVLRQGTYSESGSYSSSTTNYLTTSNPIACSSGSKINVKFPESSFIYIVTFFNGSTFLSRSVSPDRNTKEYSVIAPENATVCYVSVSIQSGTFNISECGHLGIYVDNAIDGLKSDLSNFKVVAEGDNTISFAMPTDISNIYALFVANGGDNNITNNALFLVSALYSKVAVTKIGGDDFTVTYSNGTFTIIFNGASYDIRSALLRIR